MDYINLKIFKNENDITFLLHNAINNEATTSLVTEIMTQNDSVKKRCFQDGNDIIIEFYGLSKSVEGLISDIIKKTVGCQVCPEKLTGLSSTDVLPDEKYPDTKQLQDFVPELLQDDVGENDTTDNVCDMDETVDEPTKNVSLNKQFFIQYPQLNRVHTLNRSQMVKLLLELYPVFQDNLSEFMKERRRRTIQEFTRFESDHYLRQMCNQITKIINE